MKGCLVLGSLVFLAMTVFGATVGVWNVGGIWRFVAVGIAVVGALLVLGFVRAVLGQWRVSLAEREDAGSS